MHDDAYIGGRSENNIKCVVHDDLRRNNQTTLYILPRHWLYEWFSHFHSVELIQFFHGALQLGNNLLGYVHQRLMRGMVNLPHITRSY